MPKQLPKTDRLRELVAKAIGDKDLSIDDLAIFEAEAVNTLPLQKRGLIFENARFGEDVILELATWPGAKGGLPLHRMHQRGIPLGRVFAAEPRRRADGELALNALFYLPNKESEYVSKIEKSVITDVSVTVLNKRLACSACGWDYMGEEATFEHIWERTCANGHTIGKGGVHLRCHGVEDWAELSLVDVGAAQGAKILPPPQQTFNVSASKGFDPAAVFWIRCSASEAEVTSKPKRTTTNMLTAEQIVELQANLMVANRDLNTANTKATDLETKLAAANAKVTELEGKLAEASKGDLATLKAERDSAVGLVNEICKATLATLGRASEEVPSDVSKAVELVREGRKALAGIIPPGGASKGADKDTDDQSAKLNAGRAEMTALFGKSN